MVTKPEFDHASEFHDGLAQVNKNDKYGFINKSGQLVIPLQFEYALDFNKGLAKVYKNNKCGFINTKGELVIPLILNDTRYYNWYSHQEVELIQNGKKGLLFIDEGTYIPCEYDEIVQIYNKWVMVKKNGKWGWVDHSGKTMIPCRYDAATPFDAEGRAWVYQFGERFRINKQGKMVWEK